MTKKLLIDRSRWYRGQGAAGSALLRTDGQMCCLGFYGEACGIPLDKMLGRGCFNVDCFPMLDASMEWLRSAISETRPATQFQDTLTSINDDLIANGEERETEITRIFAQHGVEVHFVDGEEQALA